MNDAKVPGASLGGLFTVLPSRPEVSEYDEPTAPGPPYDAEPVATFEASGVSPSLPER